MKGRNSLPQNSPYATLQWPLNTISTVSPDCEMCGVQRDEITSWIVYYTRNIQTVSLPSDSAHAMPIPRHFCSIFHTLGSDIYPYEYSCGDTACSDMQIASHTDCKNTSFLPCVFLCGQLSASWLWIACHTLYTDMAWTCQISGHHLDGPKYQLHSLLGMSFQLYKMTHYPSNITRRDKKIY